jgi:hypothetical protein
MRRALRGVLGLAGLIGLICLLSFEAHGRQDRPGHLGEWVFRLGSPDAWLWWEDRPNVHRFELNPLRWSVVLGIAGVVALYYAVRLSRRPAAPAPGQPAEPRPAPEPAET